MQELSYYVKKNTVVLILGVNYFKKQGEISSMEVDQVL